MTFKEIREDLKEIRYYYSMQNLFMFGAKITPPQYVLKKVEKYNNAISLAPARLYALYVGLYLHNNTQATLAEDWGFSSEYVKQLNNRLCDFLNKQFQTPIESCKL